MKSFLFLGSGVFLALLCACTPNNSQMPKEEQYLHQQEEEQGYPVLIAAPVSADYGLPFCEKQYCLEVEIFSFKSQDEWFNQFVNAQIADLIRQQLGLNQKLSLQYAVNEFVRLSDQWQEENNDQPWSVYIHPRVALQHSEITLLQITTTYQLGNRDLPEQIYYYVVDRKLQKNIRLYEMISENMRSEFGKFLQQEYQKWLETKDDKTLFPETIYWANQDWFFDEQGLAVYYRDIDLNNEGDGEAFTIYIPDEYLNRWIKQSYLQQLAIAKK